MGRSLLAVLGLFLLHSCGMFGIHLKMHNPRPGPAKKFSPETVLLGELTPIRSEFDVHFYSLDIRISAAAKTVNGWVEIGATALKTIDSVQLDLDQPLAIDEIHWQTRSGQQLYHKRKLRAVYIDLPGKIREGEKFTIHVKYHGKPVVACKPPWAGGMVWKKDKQKNAFAGVACETEGASTWFPCKDHTSDEADSVALRFSVPDDGLIVVSNGRYMGNETKNGLTAYSWKVGYPINTYNITFYLGDFVKISDTYTGIHGKQMDLSYYVLKPNEQKARNHFMQVRTQLRAYEAIYGEYPWYNDGFKLVESPYEGMEHQSAIAYGNGYTNDLNGRDDYIILHEAGHEWFGNAVTAADLADVWLQEGITTYGEALYNEKRYSKAAALAHLLDYRITIKNKYPMVGVPGRRDFDYRDGDVYSKGAWMMHTLRHQLGDDTLFFNILRTFYAENKLKVTDSKTFISVVNRVAGKDYQWFFDQYLYQRKVPFLEYCFSEDGHLYYRWTATTGDFTKFRVTVKNRESRGVLEIVPGNGVQRLKLPKGFMAESGYIEDTEGLFGLKRNKKLPSMQAQ